MLTVGTVLPVTGDLAFLGPPEIAGYELAVEDINAAGGVLGADVVIEQGDSGDTTTDTANLKSTACWRPMPTSSSVRPPRPCRRP